MKISLEIIGPARKLLQENPAQIEIPNGSNIIQMMKLAGYTETEAKYLAYLRGEETIKPTTRLNDGDYIKAVLQLGGG